LRIADFPTQPARSNSELEGLVFNPKSEIPDPKSKWGAK